MVETLLLDVDDGGDECGDPLQNRGRRLHLGLAAPVEDVEQAVEVVALHFALKIVFWLGVRLMASFLFRD